MVSHEIRDDKDTVAIVIMRMRSCIYLDKDEILIFLGLVTADVEHCVVYTMTH